MPKRVMLLLGALALSGLVACKSPTPETASPQPEPTATSAAPVSPAATTQDLSPTPEATGDAAGPTPVPTWQIPEVRADDWVRGGANAGLTLVEYSDFQ